jgi:hypothetical protein
VRRIGPVLVAVVAWAALAACGQHTGSPAPGAGAGAVAAPDAAAGLPVHSAEQLRLLAQRTSATVTSYRLAAAIDVTSPSGPMHLDVTGAARLSRTGMDLRADYTAGPGGVIPAGSYGLVLLDKVAYLKIPPMPGLTTKPWVKVDPNGADPLSATLGPLLSALGGTGDLSRSLKNLTAGAATVTASTPDTMDGAPARKYATQVDLATLAAKGDDPAVTAAARLALSAGVRTVSYDLWLDAQDRPVQVVTQVPVGQGIQASVTAHFAGFDEPVTITAPPAAEVGTLSFGH